MPPRKTSSPAQEIRESDQYRFKWIERDIKEMKEQHSDLKASVDKIDPRVRRIEIMGYVIIVLGITSKVFSAEIADILKALIGI